MYTFLKLLLASNLQVVHSHRSIHVNLHVESDPRLFLPKSTIMSAITRNFPQPVKDLGIAIVGKVGEHFTRLCFPNANNIV